MQKQLIYQDSVSNKFWNIEVSDNEFTVTYGKMGTAGQSSSKIFSDNEKCLKEAEKLINEKLKKGYIEGEGQAISTSSDSENFLTVWQSLTGAKDLNLALINHFSYLADSPGFEKVLEALMQKATEVKIESKNLVIQFGKDNFLSVSAPGKASKYKKFPASFLKVIEKGDVHKFKYNSNQMILSGDNSFDFGIYDEGENVYELFDGKESKVLNPLYHEDTADWLYNPKEKNPQGEPAIFPVIHELEDEIKNVYMNIGSLFLREIIKILEIDIKIPTIEPLENDSKKRDLAWWNNLDENWKEVFPDGVPYGIEDINLDNKSISDLSPLAYLIENKLIKLEDISLKNTQITDVSILAKAKRLFSVDISDTYVKDVSSLKQIRRLRADRVKNLEFSSIAKLKKRLSQVFLRETDLEDLTIFNEFYLCELNIVDSKVSDVDIRKLTLKIRNERKVNENDTDYFHIDVHPEIQNPLLRTVADYMDYNPEKALEAARQLSNNSDKQVDKILNDMKYLCYKKCVKYNQRNEKLYSYFRNMEDELNKILKLRK